VGEDHIGVLFLKIICFPLASFHITQLNCKGIL
jgi:hypothetical protein